MNHILPQAPFSPELLPSWFEERRRLAAEQAEQLPAPSRRVESWRFGSPARESLEGFEPALPCEPEALATLMAAAPAVQNAIRVVYANGRPVLIPEQLPEGLAVMDLQDFIRNCPELARQHLQTTPEQLGSEQLAARHAAQLHHGLVILVEREITRPLELLHAVSGSKTPVFPYTLVIAQPGGRIRILERHISADQGEHFCCAMQEHHLAASSGVAYALVQELNRHSRAVELSHITADDSAEMEHLTSHPGGAWARQETICLLTGAGAGVRLISANALNGSRELDQRTYQRHACRGASSNLLYTNMLDDDAKSIFSGMIMVEEGAHDTSAYQSNRNLILSPRAEANSIPGLEILADRVQCSHGTATSSISQEEIFYLLSRGIPEREARAMIARGFLKNALNQFSDEAIRTAVESLALP